MIIHIPDLISALWRKERSATLMYMLTVRHIPILEMLKKNDIKRIYLKI